MMFLLHDVIVVVENVIWIVLRVNDILFTGTTQKDKSES